eukprot:5089420-Pleurochrysis_carterae.AAC.1
MERRGQLTCTDPIGPFKPSKFTGSHYRAPFLDMHQAPATLASSHPRTTSYTTALRSYLVRNHCCEFADGALYGDNDIVLNSAKVGLVLKDFEMYHTNSCEYQPWQNPTERHMRTLQESMRVMHERAGGAGEEYWEYSMTQASLISNVTHHRLGTADGPRTSARQVDRHR